MTLNGHKATDDTAPAEGARDHETLEREFVRLARRYAELGKSLYARDQRERSRLQAPLMRLYIALHPGQALKESDDIDILLRVPQRNAVRTRPQESQSVGGEGGTPWIERREASG